MNPVLPCYIVLHRRYDPTVHEDYRIIGVTTSLDEAKHLAINSFNVDEADDPREKWESNADEDLFFWYQFNPIYAIKPQKESVFTCFIMTIQNK